MFGWHHRLNGHEFEQAVGDNEDHGILVWWAVVHGSQRVRHELAIEQYNAINKLLY